MCGYCRREMHTDNTPFVINATVHLVQQLYAVTAVAKYTWTTTLIRNPLWNQYNRCKRCVLQKRTNTITFSKWVALVVHTTASFTFVEKKIQFLRERGKEWNDIPKYLKEMKDAAPPSEDTINPLESAYHYTIVISPKTNLAVFTLHMVHAHIDGLFHRIFDAYS